MKKESYSATKAIREIEHTVNEMLNLFLLLKSRMEELSKLRSEFKSIDDNNPDYFEILHDHRENHKKILKFLILILSFIVDFLLLYTTLDILSKQFGWWDIMKVIVPFTLIIGEVIISYFSAIQMSYDVKSSHIIRNLQYYVIPLLVGFSLFAIFYHAESYNKEIDSVSFISYMTFEVLIKILLLISSIMLHL